MISAQRGCLGALGWVGAGLIHEHDGDMINVIGIYYSAPDTALQYTVLFGPRGVTEPSHCLHKRPTRFAPQV